MSRYKVSLIVGSNFFPRKRVHHLFTFEFVVVKLILHDSILTQTLTFEYTFLWIHPGNLDGQRRRPKLT